MISFNSSFLLISSHYKIYFISFQSLAYICEGFFLFEEKYFLTSFVFSILHKMSSQQLYVCKTKLNVELKIKR